jgi:hypothetical protein
MQIIASNICSAYASTGVIGSKVENFSEFNRVLREAIAAHDFSTDRIPGQAVLSIPDAIPYVSSGVGRPVPDPDAYVLRLYRSRVSAFLKRAWAAPVESCSAVVYTTRAYLDDPDITHEEAARVAAHSVVVPVTHVLVALLASSGPSSQLGPYRFTANLAGGNHEAQVWTADEIRAKARAIMDYDQNWTTVAD